jgi:hypothetical protein
MSKTLSVKDLVSGMEINEQYRHETIRLHVKSNAKRIPNGESFGWVATAETETGEQVTLFADEQAEHYGPRLSLANVKGEPTAPVASPKEEGL